jgi:class 3 adenylate cyclase
VTEERRLVTVLFADVTGSTSLGETLDPEALRGLLSRYFAVAREVVEGHGGVVEKFIGDAVMAVFGVPVAHGDDVARALSAAIVLRDRVQADPALGERLPIRLGVNSGEVVASRDPDAGEFLVTGDAVNVAARLQQNAEPWSIVVGERAVHAAGEGFAFRSIPDVAAKGKSAPVAASVLVGRSAPRPAGRTPLVGRDDDLAQLDLVAGRAFRERRPFLVSVIAAPGVGKSRLIEEFIERLRAREPSVGVAIAQCLPYGQRLTYWPLRALLLELLELPNDVPPETVRRRAIAWLSEAGDPNPERTAHLLASTIGAGEVDLVDRGVMFAAWRTAVELAAAQGPLLLVVEDLHWSSDSLLDLFEFILQPRGEVPLLMVALARPELLDRRPGWGGGRRNFVSLALEPLPDQDVAELVTDLLDGPAPDIVRSVVARADGNPFYAGEIVRSVVERVSDLRDAAAVEACLASLPDTVQATILARLDVLPPEPRRLLQLGSVFGRSFSLRGVAALEATLEADGQVLVDELDDRDLVRHASGDVYTFRHILIREVAYGTLTRAERIRLHTGAGAWLESVAGADADALSELIAYHYREAIALARLIGQDVDEGARERAVRWLGRAAATATAGGAVQEAARHLRSAIELAGPDELPELYLRLGQSHFGGDVGIAAFTQAYELGRERGRSADFTLLALSLRLAAMTRWFASVARQPTEEEYGRLVAEGRELLAHATDERVRATFHISQSFYPFWLGNLGRRATTDQLAAAEADARIGLEIATRLDDALLRSAALDGLGGVLSSTGRHSEALVIARSRVAFEDRLSLQERLDAYNVLCWQSSFIGELDETITFAERGIASVQPGQDPGFSLAVASWLSYGLALKGRWDEVPAAGERLRRLWLEADRPSAGYALSGFIAALDVARARREEDEIARLAETLADIVDQFGEDHPTRRLHAFVGPDLDALARICARPEFYVERLHHVEHALATCADRRHPLDADVIDRLIVLARSQETRPLLAQALRVDGGQRGDADALREALALAERMGATPLVGRLRVELGEMTGDAVLEAEGIEILERLGDVDQLERMRKRRDG